MSFSVVYGYKETLLDTLIERKLSVCQVKRWDSLRFSLTLSPIVKVKSDLLHVYTSDLEEASPMELRYSGINYRVFP